ncbi:ion channel [Roseibium aggregatum]|uniref:Voltage-gated potassium channel n=1 Tax=Roseibium aggregatum TaxID=187304 RepID=A0A0M6Y488_9HYPH|nr:ion channel [Roseibium aggregatum]CTQ44488.1 voltage-gated potassium channel [Roseibium aggregatum]
MPILQLIISRLYQHVLELKLWLLATLICAYMVISWILFFLAGETGLTGNPLTFIYFAATTASTVGYGDLSPSTEAGRMVAAFWFFPGALLIFSAVLGRLTGVLVEGVRRMADGNGNYERVQNATVIVGYHRDKTPLMVENLVAGQDGDDKIILLADSKNVEVPEGVRLIRAERMDALQSLRRAAIPGAQKVLVYAGSDAETFNTCLAIRELNETVHIAAYFEDRDTARRAGNLAQIEPVVSNACEALVRAAQDPGAGQILMALSTAGLGATIYSAIVQSGGGTETDKLEQALSGAEGTLIAVSQPDDPGFLFRPFPKTLKTGGSIYYLANKRLAAGEITSGLGGADVRITV